MTDKMMEGFENCSLHYGYADDRRLEENRTWFRAGWQAAQAEAVQVPSCTTCANRGRVNGLSQETYCDWCLWQGQGYRVSHYAPLPKKEPRHE